MKFQCPDMETFEGIDKLVKLYLQKNTMYGNNPPLHGIMLYIFCSYMYMHIKAQLKALENVVTWVISVVGISIVGDDQSRLSSDL